MYSKPQKLTASWSRESKQYSITVPHFQHKSSSENLQFKNGKKSNCEYRHDDNNKKAMQFFL